ncbi:RBM41 protein, partial [Polyodon spathula]|nr:RBM41 protein [Polyodon spathula]
MYCVAAIETWQEKETAEPPAPTYPTPSSQAVKQIGSRLEIYPAAPFTRTREQGANTTPRICPQKPQFRSAKTLSNSSSTEESGTTGVSSRSCQDEPLPEAQETEGERQLHNLLRQQLDAAVNTDQCVAKKKCFASAALYKAFGEQASRVWSLTQFRSLQDGEKERASLRELGLGEVEI